MTSACSSTHPRNYGADGRCSATARDELDRREPDSEAFIRPQRRYADMLVSFKLPDGNAEQDQMHLDAELTLYDGLHHPDLSPFINGNPDGLTLVQDGTARILHIPGRMDPAHAAAIEEAIWARMHFATHLRARRLGEFTIGTELFRSESLALVQLLILYHLVTAKAAVALGGTGARSGDAAPGESGGDRQGDGRVQSASSA
jgi:phosphoribulokinase